MSKEKTISLAVLSGLMLVLSYLFSLNESSGAVPIILLFAGLISASVILLGFLATIGK